MTRVVHVLNDEDNFEALVLLDEASGDTLEVQRSLVFSEQDVRLGMADYCLVRASAASFYGGLEAWQVSGETLSIRLASAAAQALDLPDEFELDLSPEGTELVRAVLPRLLDEPPGPAS